jgi:ubiquinone/menaquinone biosynthesis C-methylase UbiE
MQDLRREVARYYDAATTQTDDIDFYVQHILPDDATILELGCGTGRVLIPLSKHCDSIVGVDKSAAMLEFCRDKLLADPQSKGGTELLCQDITSLDLQTEFSLIIAPFRVFQNIDTDDNVNAFFQTVHRHLSYQGCCILNVFRPITTAKELFKSWGNEDEVLSWEKPFDKGVLRHSYRRVKIKRDPIVIYPELIYRYYETEKLVDEVSCIVPMRVYYPDEFKRLIQCQGFKIVETWGGYVGERYGEGPELVVKFIKG